MARGTYTVKHARISSGTAVLLPIEVEHPTAVIELMRAWIDNTDSEVSEQWPVEIVTLSTDGTNVTTPTVVAHDLAMAAHGLTVRGMATAAFVVDNILLPRAFNILNGWEYIPRADGEEIEVAAAKTLALHLPVTRTAVTISVGMTLKIHG